MVGLKSRSASLWPEGPADCARAQERSGCIAGDGLNQHGAKAVLDVVEGRPADILDRARDRSQSAEGMESASGKHPERSRLLF